METAMFELPRSACIRGDTREGAEMAEMAETKTTGDHDHLRDRLKDHGF